MRVRARGIYCFVDNFQISIVPICWKVSSTSCLTNEIATADSSHWLSRRANATSLILRVSPYGSVNPAIGRRLTSVRLPSIALTRSIKPAGILTLCLRTKWHNRDKIAYASQKMAVRYLHMPIFLNGKRLDIKQCRSPHYKSGEYVSG